MNSRIKAFTLYELIVVMLLSSILFGIVFQALHIIRIHFHDFQQRGENIIKIKQLHSQLFEDFHASKTVKLEGTILWCIFLNKRIGYQFEDDKILRLQGGLKDIFDFQPHDMKFKFLQDRNTFNETPIVELNFKIVYNQEEFNFHFHKKYGSDVLFKHAININQFHHTF